VAVATLSASRATHIAERAALRATYVPGLRGALGERVQVERAREGWVDGRLVTLTNDSLVLERPDGQDVSVGFGSIVRVEVIGGDPTGPRARETLRFDTPLRARTSRGALRAWVGQAVVVELSDGTRLRGKLDAIEGTRILLELGGQKAVVVELSDARTISR
jgi:ribosome maturation factor RimP